MATKKRPAAKKLPARRPGQPARNATPARKAAKKSATTRVTKAAKRATPARKTVRKTAAKRPAKAAGSMAQRFAKWADAPAKKAPAKKSARKSGYKPVTTPTSQSVGQFLAGIADAARRADAEEIARMLGEITGVEAKMWGPSIVGFGQYHYRYDSGHEGDMCVAGFSPRKDALTLYVMPGFERYGELLTQLGKYRAGKSCLYVKRLADVDRNVLRELLERSVAAMAPKRTA